MVVYYRNLLNIQIAQTKNVLDQNFRLRVVVILEQTSFLLKDAKLNSKNFLFMTLVARPTV